MFTTFGLVEGLAMSPEVGDNREILAYFLFMLRALLFSTCLRSKPLLACGQRALRAYNDIGEWPFVQARQPFANIVKLLCSFLCPLTLGAFVLLLRSLVEGWLGKSFPFSVFRFPFPALLSSLFLGGWSGRL